MSPRVLELLCKQPALGIIIFGWCSVDLLLKPLPQELDLGLVYFDKFVPLLEFGFKSIEFMCILLMRVTY